MSKSDIKSNLSSNFCDVFWDHIVGSGELKCLFCLKTEIAMENFCSSGK